MNMNPDFEKLHMPKKTLSSPAELVGDKFVKKAIAAGIDLSILTTDEAILVELEKSRLLKGPFASVNLPEVIKFLRDEKLVPTLEEVRAKQKAIEKEMRQRAEAEIKPEEIHIETGVGLKEVQDENLVHNFQSAEKIQEAEKIKKEQRSVTESDEKVNELYEQMTALQEGRDIETDDYYYEFSVVGYSRQEIVKDIASLHEREEEFALEDSGLKKKNKKIATLTETALEYGVSKMNWFGDRVKIQPTSKFDDIKRRVDGVLEVIVEGSESKFLGLGIDVTFGGQAYHGKIEDLLEDIENGYGARIKYFKDHKGVPQKEFVVPKIILSFNIDDVRDLVSCFKDIDTPEAKEKFRNNPLKADILHQIIEQCGKFAAFARKHNNPVSFKYEAILESIRDLSEDYPEIREALSTTSGIAA
ncbi:MAG: hypothetical protein KBC98_00950 [Candidatus Pacebacteria bacterium]|nr:hypothetical protein [Candidatus Paceibacterota bacterium]